MKSEFKLKSRNKHSSAFIYITDKGEYPGFRSYLNVVIYGNNIQALAFYLPVKDMECLANGILSNIKKNAKGNKL